MDKLLPPRQTAVRYHPSMPNFNGNLFKPPSILDHERVNISHIKQRMLLSIHVLIYVKPETQETPTTPHIINYFLSVGVVLINATSHEGHEISNQVDCLFRGFFKIANHKLNKHQWPKLLAFAS